MFATVLGWLGNLLGGPFARAAVDAYKAKLDAENSADARAAELAGRELALQQRETELQEQRKIAEIGKWYEPDKLMGYAVAVYFGKLLIYDKVLALGSTDPLAGWAATTANLIIMFYFGKRGIENVMRIWKH
ncbi:MAG TPA: hypothetical protein VFA53_02430 [Xanthobacteraceae bacterium]|nr:hypothetical protein [Xanthobacteraceae bacterium]